MEIKTFVQSLKGGKWFGSYGMAFCPCHDNKKTPALSLSLSQSGTLLVKCFAGCEAISILKALDGKASFSSYSQRDLKQAQEEHKAKQAKQKEYISQVMGQLIPIQGTVAEYYLREIRKIPYIPIPSLMFHPELYHSPTKKTYPAMVGLVSRVNAINDIYGLHRTYLDRNTGKKADIPQNKMMFGACSGGGVILSYEQGKPWIICEGIETGLSVKTLFGNEYSMIAGLSTSGMQNITLPYNQKHIIIASDNDIAGQKAKDALAIKASSQGYKVQFLKLDAHFNDWNDALIQNHNIQK